MQAAHPAFIGVHATSPHPNWTLGDLFKEIAPDLESRVISGSNALRRSRQKTLHQNPDWARAASLSSSLRKTTQITGPSTIAGMDIDEIEAPSVSPSEPAVDPRDELREQLLAYLRSALPQIIRSPIKFTH